MGAAVTKWLSDLWPARTLALGTQSQNTEKYFNGAFPNFPENGVYQCHGGCTGERVIHYIDGLRHEGLNLFGKHSHFLCTL